MSVRARPTSFWLQSRDAIDAPLAGFHQSPGRFAQVGTRAVAATRRRVAPLSNRVGEQDRRASVFQPRHGRADHRIALHLPHAGRPAGVGRRAPDLRAQDPHRPARSNEQAAHGALAGGVAFEALNNAGALDANLLVILNDNDMSISRPVGALNNYLARLMSGRFYAAMRRGSEKMFKGMPPVLEFAKRAEEHVKGMVTPSTLFEEFGFNYIGPVDGHDLDVLLDTLGNIRQLTGPQFLHVVTQKGKGYAHAEQDSVLYHGVSKFDPVNGIAPAKDRDGVPLA